MNNRNGGIVGIDFGSSFSRIAQLDKDGNPVALKNADDKASTPSIVLLGEGGPIIVGPSFERRALESPDRVVEDIKRELGKKEFHVVYQEKKLTSEFIAALILKKLRSDAERRVGAVNRAVVAAPSCFCKKQRKALRDAVRIAGLQCFDLVNDLQAAALAHTWSTRGVGVEFGDIDENPMLVLSLGACTCEIGVVRYTDGQLRMLASRTDTELGGMDWTWRLVEKLALQFVDRFHEDPRAETQSRCALIHDCDRIKHALSTSVEIRTPIQSMGHRIEVDLSRTEFERLTIDLSDRIKTLIENVLMDAQVAKRDIREVLLAGAATRMPVVEATVLEVVETASLWPQHLLREDLIGQGTALLAAIVEIQDQSCPPRFNKNIVKRLRALQHLVGALDVPSEVQRRERIVEKLRWGKLFPELCPKTHRGFIAGTCPWCGAAVQFGTGIPPY